MCSPTHTSDDAPIHAWQAFHTQFRSPVSLHPGSCINSVLGESLGAGGGGKDGKPRAAAVAGKRGASVAVGGVAGRGGTSLAKELLVFSTVSQSVSGCRRFCRLLS